MSSNKALNSTDLGHDNLDRLMRVYFKKTKFANERKNWQPGTTGECKFCQGNNITEPESLKHVLYECQDTKKCLELTLGVFGLPKIEEIKIKELILWKFINNEHYTRDYNKEVVFKTITTLFLCEYLKMRYSAVNSAELEAQSVVENILKHIKYSRSPTGGTPYVTKFTRVKFTFYIFKLNNICMYRINIPNFDNKC